MELPYELEYEIIQFAVRDDPTTAASLQLVAHRVKLWVDAILHEYVVLDDCKTERTIQPRKRDQLYASTLASNTAKYVSSLCLTYHHKLRHEELANIALCTRVFRLACWVEYSRYPSITTMIAAMPLQMLSIELNHFMTLPKSSGTRWLSQLSHLELIFWTHEEPPKLEPLDFLPSLTHVCLNWGSPEFPTSVEIVLDTCPILKTLIITRMSGKWERLEEFQKLPQAEHVDIVVLNTLKGLQDWKPGGQSIWERADEMIASKNRSATGQKVIGATDSDSSDSD